MKDIIIDMPPVLRELHGRQARLSTLVITYLCGLAVAAAVTLYSQVYNLEWWKQVLVFIVFTDIAGGVASNLSSPANVHYSAEGAKRLVFLLIHAIQPAVLALIFPQHFLFLLTVFLFAIAASLALNFIKRAELQQNLASLLVAVGITVACLADIPVKILPVFAALYMIKLILGFSVKRPEMK